MYKLRYYSTYKDLSNNTIRIEIYKNTIETVTAEELLLSADAVSITYEADDMFKPLKQSGCTVNVLTGAVLTELYTGKLNDITLKVFKNDSLFWYGYLTPNIYTSEFSSEYDLLSLEFVDTIAQLENTKYSYISTKGTIRSFYEIITSILNSIDTDKIINLIYLHSSLSYNSSDDLLNKLMIQERNFFDEEAEPQNSKEILEDIISYLGMTLIQFENKYLVLDYEGLKAGNYSFVVYDRTADTNIITTLPSDLRNLTDIGIAEANASISLGNIYNKINLISNNNSINELIPELFDEDDLINQNADINKYYEKIIGSNTHLSAYFKSKENWRVVQKTGLLGDIDIPEITIDNLDTVYYGAFFQKTSNYKTVDGEPANVTWTDNLTMAGDKYVLIGVAPVKPTWESFLSLNNTEMVIFKGGYFIINLDYMFSQSPIASDLTTSTDATYYSGQYSAGFKDTRFACRLRIGNYYWTGEKWDLYSNYTNNIAYYNRVTYEGTYNYEYRYWYLDGNNEKVFLTLEEYNKINLKDRFWLIRKNKAGEKIFCTTYSLTNQVSYKDNLIDADEGVLIPLPESILYGQIIFELCAPDSLGTAQCYRTDEAVNYSYARYCHISSLNFIYTNNKNYKDTFTQKQYDPDILYSNVIDDNIVTELEDLELRINTYTDKAGSYSYVITKDAAGAYSYVESLYNKRRLLSLKPEENIINKYTEYYSTPKFIYSNTINNADIKPYTMIHENTLNKNMVVKSMTYNLSNDSVSVVTTEL